MAVSEIKIIEGQKTLSQLEPGTLINFSGGRNPLRAALITDSDTVYYIQGGKLGLVVPVSGPRIDSYPYFSGRLHWRKNTADEPFKRSSVDPTRLVFLPR